MISWEDTHDDQIASMTDHKLVEAYERTNGQPGNANADALFAEIQRRGLDV